MTDEFVVHCPNRSCGIIFRPDPLVYKEGDTRCPKCGTDFTLPPPWKYQDQYREEMP
jgi:uncharacterized Zn finger protein (UPF0148 family)